MLKVERHKQFKKDLKKIKFTDQYFSKYIVYLSKLIQEQSLPDEALNHSLKGNYIGYKEFHISGDLLIVYTIKDEILKLIRIGSHSEIFN